MGQFGNTAKFGTKCRDKGFGVVPDCAFGAPLLWVGIGVGAGRDEFNEQPSVGKGGESPTYFIECQTVPSKDEVMFDRQAKNHFRSQTFSCRWKPSVGNAITGRRIRKIDYCRENFSVVCVGKVVQMINTYLVGVYCRHFEAQGLGKPGVPTFIASDVKKSVWPQACEHAMNSRML